LKRRIVIAGVLALALGGLLLYAIAPRGHPEIVIERNLVYGKGGDTDLLLDLAMPKSGVGPFPAVMFLHGRGWREGSRHDMSQFIEGMAGLGYVSVTIEYRLVPAARFPAQVEDCKAAVRWLRANAAKYRIDADHVGVVGFSAGGHLASMLGVTGPGDGLEGTGGNPGQSSRVQAVVSFFGPTDFSTRDWPGDLEREVIVPFLGGSFGDRPDTYRKASPYNYATKDAPPFLFFHGSDDELVPVDQSKRLADKLKSVGVSAEVVVFDHEHHGFSDATNHVAMRRMLDFLGERLRK
jgi:acetyl esterase/lipase